MPRRVPVRSWDDEGPLIKDRLNPDSPSRLHQRLVGRGLDFTTARGIDDEDAVMLLRSIQCDAPE
jgi:hypothetical protein